MNDRLKTAKPKLPAGLIPREDEEQKQLVHWLRLRHYDHFRVPNETYTESRFQKLQNYALGVSAGVPDLFVVVKMLDNRYTQLVAIELKRQRGAKSTVSVYQQEWLDRLNHAGIPARVCYGAEEAIKFIDEVRSSWAAKNPDLVPEALRGTLQ